MRKTLSDKGVAALKPRAKRYVHPDPELIGLSIRVQPSGKKYFQAITVDPSTRKQVWIKIGAADSMTIDEAREKARVVLSRVRSGLAPVETKTATFAEVSSNWLARHVDAKGLRSAREIRRLLDRHILPEWRHKEFVAIDRSDIAALLDKVEDGHGARAADYCLNVTRSISNWHASRVNGYHPPFVRGMRRQTPSEQARERILSDDELRTIWNAAEANGTFGAIIRMCLLTAQRRTKIATMKWSDISLDGEWTIAAEAREKDNAGSLLLPDMALAIIASRHRLAGNLYIFPGRGTGPYAGFSQGKTRFDAKLPPDVAPWVLHDLRRSSRSLMSRAGVRPDVAERTLGHAVGGVQAIYDRHTFRTEKQDALQRLADLIASIINPPEQTNVTPIRRAAR